MWEHRSSPNIMVSLPSWIQLMTTGALPHCGDAVISIIMRLSGRSTNGSPRFSELTGRYLEEVVYEEAWPTEYQNYDER